MKLDKWPEEIECAGWRWTLQSYWIGEVPADGYLGPRYIRKEKLHVPPTMREIMEHLLKGGWVKEVGCSDTCFYRINGEQLEIANSVIREWGKAYCGVAMKYARSWVYLVPVGQWEAA